MSEATPLVWLQPGLLVIYGTALDAELHAHHAIQLVLPDNEAECRLDQQQINGAMIINSQVPHQLSMKAGWILLVEPESDIGQQLKTVIKEEQAIPISVNNPEFHFSAFDLNHQCDLSLLLPSLLSHTQLSSLEINATSSSNITDGSSTVLDPRISVLLRELDTCLLGQCIKPASWKAAQVAQQMSLSQSRFLHLFRQQLGIAWRSFLLWKRLTCAVQAMISGQSATDAAYIAGFSDSAHLSRTFRQMFGMSIQQARRLFPSQTIE